jgi:hypothetical protein
MSMNSDIVKGVVGTSADGYKTFGDIKLYGGNVYKVANDDTTPAAVGRFCYVRLVSSVLTATKPYYDTSATVDPIDDSRAFLYCNGFVLEADSVTGELYVAVSGVVGSETLVGSSSDLNVNAESTYFLDWGTEGAGAVDTLQSGVSGVVSTFLDGDATATADDYPILEASIRPVAVGTGTGMVKLSFEPGKSSGLFSDRLTLHYNDTSRAVLSAVPLVGAEISSNRNVDVIINDSDDIGSGEYFRVRSGSNPVEVFKVEGDGNLELGGSSSPEVVVRTSSAQGSARVSLLEGTGSVGDATANGYSLLYNANDNELSLSEASGATVTQRVRIDRDSNDLKLIFSGGYYLQSGVAEEANGGVTHDLTIDPANSGFLARASNHSFTATHTYRVSEDLYSSAELGQAITLSGGVLGVSSAPSSSAVCGILCVKYEVPENNFIARDSLGNEVSSGDKLLLVSAVGDSRHKQCNGFKVCDEGGDISAGDLLVTSSTTGRLMKQADDIIRSSTVGKAMQDVTFNDSGEADDIYGFIYCG